MRSIQILLAAAGFAALGASAQQAPQGNADAGKNKVFQCQGCHGIADWKTAFPEVYRVPKLGGQKPAYLVAAMKAYKSGERDYQTMRAMMDPLSEQDMADIAAYYASEQASQVASNVPVKSQEKK